MDLATTQLILSLPAGNQSNSLLLRMPTEVRLIILRQLLVAKRVVAGPPLRAQIIRSYYDLVEQMVIQNLAAQLLRCCQQLLVEGSTVLYNYNTLPIRYGHQILDFRKPGNRRKPRKYNFRLHLQTEYLLLHEDECTPISDSLLLAHRFRHIELYFNTSQMRSGGAIAMLRRIAHAFTGSVVLVRVRGEYRRWKVLTDLAAEVSEQIITWRQCMRDLMQVLNHCSAEVSVLHDLVKPLIPYVCFYAPCNTGREETLCRTGIDFSIEGGPRLHEMRAKTNEQSLNFYNDNSVRTIVDSDQLLLLNPSILSTADGIMEAV